MKLSVVVLSLYSVSANVMFHTRSENDCKKTCDLNRICNFWTFDNREDQDRPDKTKHACHHHNHHAFGTIHKDQEGFKCGSMSEDISERTHNCRFEFDTDLPTRKFIQTHNADECRGIFEACADCDNFQWREFDDVTHDTPEGEVTERIPGHCVVHVQQQPTAPPTVL